MQRCNRTCRNFPRVQKFSPLDHFFSILPIFRQAFHCSLTRLVPKQNKKKRKKEENITPTVKSIQKSSSLCLPACVASFCQCRSFSVVVFVCLLLLSGLCVLLFICCILSSSASACVTVRYNTKHQTSIFFFRLQGDLSPIAHSHEASQN